MATWKKILLSNGNSGNFVKGDGSFDTNTYSATNHSHSDATTSTAGFMTAADKSKLNNIAANATNVTNTNQLTNGAGFITGVTNISGNAGTATTLQTARNINGVSFNGSADITIADSTKLPLTGGTLSGVLSFAGNTRYGISKIYNSSLGDMFGIEQVSAAQTGTSGAATRIYTAGNDINNYVSLGYYTDTTTFVDLLKIVKSGAATFSSSVTATSLVKSGGTSTQFLKADGTVDTSTYATQTYVNTSVADLVASAPATLNTLNELALALGSDANFSTTMTNSLANKLSLSGGTLTGDLSWSTTGAATTNTAKIFFGVNPSPNGSLLASTIGNYGVDGYGLILQAGYASDMGGIKITDDGVAIFGAADEGLLHLVDEDSNVTRLSISDGGALTVNGSAVSLDGHTHSYLPLSGGTMTDTIMSNKVSGRLIGNDSYGTNFGWIAMYGTTQGIQLGFEGSLGGQLITGAGANYGVLVGKVGLAISANNGGTNHINITSSGNVGIGTSPSYLLDLLAASSADTIIRLTKTASVNATIKAVAGALSFGVDTSGGATERMRINSSGYVGIGTSSPNTVLEVNGEIRSTRSGVSSQYLKIEGGNSVGPYIIAVGTAKILSIRNDCIASSDIYFDQANSGIYAFHQQGIEKMRLDLTGNVGIGTTTPAYKLDVNGTGRFSGVLTLTQSNSGAVRPLILDGTNTHMYLKIVTNSNYEAMTQYENPTAGAWYTGLRAAAGLGSTSSYHIYSSTYGGDVFVLNTSGSATFSSSVTATSFVKSGGTASQYLLADGTTSTLTASGTFTPAFGYPAGSTSASGSYFKVGNLVWVNIDITFTYSSYTTGVIVTGLPYTVSGFAGLTCAFYNGSVPVPFTLLAYTGTTTVELRKTSAASFTTSDFSSTGGNRIIISGVYKT